MTIPCLLMILTVQKHEREQEKEQHLWVQTERERKKHSLQETLPLQLRLQEGEMELFASRCCGAKEEKYVIEEEELEEGEEGSSGKRLLCYLGSCDKAV